MVKHNCSCPQFQRFCLANQCKMFENGKWVLRFKNAYDDPFRYFFTFENAFSIFLLFILWQMPRNNSSVAVIYQFNLVYLGLSEAAFVFEIARCYFSMQLYMTWYIRSFFGFTFLNIFCFFKYSCTNIFHRRSLYTFYFKVHTHISYYWLEPRLYHFHIYYADTFIVVSVLYIVWSGLN